MNRQTINILGVDIEVTNPPKAIAQICRWVEEKKKVYVCIANVNTIIDSLDDEGYRRVVNEAAMATPDGMPLVWVGRSQGQKEMARTYGPDLMRDLCLLGPGRYKHFFYGGTADTIRLLVQKLKNEYPDLNIVGSYAPDFLGLQEEESRHVLSMINNAAPDILWVGLGSPKQDYWMSIHRDKLDVPVMVGVGAAFDFLAGTKPQAPVWMQRCGLEWFFRLCCEPKRLWRRYFVGNTKFIYYLFKDILHRGLLKP